MYKRILFTFFLASYSSSVYSSWFGDLFKDVTVETKMPEITQNDNNVIVTMNVSDDIDSDDINVEIKDKTLYVSGMRKSKQEVHEKDYYHKEISRSSFNRVVSLPCLVDELGTTAEMTDGVLVITMPKIREEETAAKKIKVIKAKK